LHWPTFNIADSAISVGLVMLLLEMLLVRKPAREEAGKPST
jgi:lipoprotein signal peptidase